MSSKKTTIHDIAKILGIDSSTVSRALNDSPRVKQKTKDKVLALASELGYQRNELASNLRKNKTNTIGVIVPRISRHFFSSAIAGIEETAYQAGYQVIICQSLEKLEREREIAATLLSYHVDGLLISISMETKNYDHLAKIKKLNIPHVFFDRHCDIPHHNNVLIDDYQAGYSATSHLLENGCRRIVHFSGPLNMAIYHNRYQGYKAALSDHGIPLDRSLLYESKLMTKDGVDCIKNALSQSDKIDGIFSSNDVAAIGALQYLKSIGKRIPDDIAIVGFSNEPISSIIEPNLTTINQSGSDMGRRATTLLLERINNNNKDRQGQTVIIKSQLLKRQSSQRILTQSHI